MIRYRARLATSRSSRLATVAATAVALFAFFPLLAAAPTAAAAAPTAAAPTAAAPTAAAATSGTALRIEITATDGSYLPTNADGSQGIVVLEGLGPMAPTATAKGDGHDIPIAEAAYLLSRTNPIEAVLSVSGAPARQRTTVLSLSNLTRTPSLGLTAEAEVVHTTGKLLHVAAEGAGTSPPGTTFGAAHLHAVATGVALDQGTPEAPRGSSVSDHIFLAVHSSLTAGTSVQFIPHHSQCVSGQFGGSFGVNDPPSTRQLDAFDVVSTGTCWFQPAQATWTVRITDPLGSRESIWAYITIEQWAPATYATSCVIPSQQQHLGCTGQLDVLNNVTNVWLSP